jgi:hypothetical protein
VEVFENAGPLTTGDLQRLRAQQIKQALQISKILEAMEEAEALPTSYTVTESATANDAVFRNWAIAQALSNVYLTSTVSTTSATTTNQAVWHIWAGGSGSAYTASSIHGQVFNAWVKQHETIREETEKEKWVQAMGQTWRAIAYEVRAKQQEEERAIAKKRARKLLVENLSEEQKKMYEEKGCFIVEVEGVQYRIDQGTHGNVKELDKNGKPVYSYCVQPDGVPAEDAMLAQKLALQTNIAYFKQRANRRPFYN